MDAISIDGSKTRAHANKYNNLTEEDIQKLLYIIEQGIITGIEENKALEKAKNKCIDDDDFDKEKIKTAL